MALLNINPVIARANRLYVVHQADGDLGRVGEGAPRAPKGRQRVNKFQPRVTITSMSEGQYLVFQDQFRKR